MVAKQLARDLTYGLVLRIDVLDREFPDRFAADRGVTVYEGHEVISGVLVAQ